LKSMAMNGRYGWIDAGARDGISVPRDFPRGYFARKIAKKTIPSASAELRMA
jgi:hypothetical protein